MGGAAPRTRRRTGNPKHRRQRFRLGALVCFELDWGEAEKHWVRLQIREGLGDRVIVNMEEPLGSGSFHH